MIVPSRGIDGPFTCRALQRELSTDSYTRRVDHNQNHGRKTQHGFADHYTGVGFGESAVLTINRYSDVAQSDSNVLETIVRRHIRELQAIAASLEKHAA
jgi:hypothetical protein